MSEMLMKQNKLDEAKAVLDEVIRTLRAAHFAEGIHRAELQ